MLNSSFLILVKPLYWRQILASQPCILQHRPENIHNICWLTAIIHLFFRNTFSSSESKKCFVDTFLRNSGGFMKTPTPGGVPAKAERDVQNTLGRKVKEIFYGTSWSPVRMMSPGRSVVNCEIQETTCKKMFIDKNTTNKNKNNFNNTNNKTAKIDWYVFCVC